MPDIEKVIEPPIKRAIFELSEEQETLLRDNILFAIEQTKKGILLRKFFSSISESIIPPPVRDLSSEEVAAVIEMGRLNPWNRHGHNSIKWVLDRYSLWIPGLLTNHIRQADKKLYYTFMQAVHRGGLPPGVDIPTAEENWMRKKAAGLISDADVRSSRTGQLRLDRDKGLQTSEP